MIEKLLMSAVGGIALAGAGAAYIVHGKDTMIAEQRAEITTMRADLTQRDDGIHRAIHDLQIALGVKAEAPAKLARE